MIIGFSREQEEILKQNFYKHVEPFQMYGSNMRTNDAFSTYGKGLDLSVFEHTHISYNCYRRKRIKFIITDHDHEDFDYIPSGFPRPWLTIYNKDNLKHHRIWKLENPVWTGEKSLYKPRKLLMNIIHAINTEMGGDVNYRMNLSKNLFHDDYYAFFNNGLKNTCKLSDFEICMGYEGNNGRYTGGFIAPKSFYYGCHSTPSWEDTTSRNCFIFNNARIEVKNNLIFDYKEILGICCKYNHFKDSESLRPSEIACIARSIHKFMCFKFRGGSAGPVLVRSPEEIKNRQVDGAREAAQIKKTKNCLKLKIYMDEMGITKENCVYSDIAKNIGITRQTVSKLIKEFRLLDVSVSIIEENAKEARINLDARNHEKEKRKHAFQEKLASRKDIYRMTWAELKGLDDRKKQKALNEKKYYYNGIYLKMNKVSKEHRYFAENAWGTLIPVNYEKIQSSGINDINVYDIENIDHDHIVKMSYDTIEHFKRKQKKYFDFKKEQEKMILISEQIKNMELFNPGYISSDDFPVELSQFHYNEAEKKLIKNGDISMLGNSIFKKGDYLRH